MICDMRKAKASIINRFNENPEYLPADFTTKAMNALLNFALDNSFFEFNHEYYAQDDGVKGKLIICIPFP